MAKMVGLLVCEPNEEKRVRKHQVGIAIEVQARCILEVIVGIIERPSAIRPTLQCTDENLS